ncbi:unnamed protein product [Trichobilharzia regenti]|nr:unnamed protein product [Trichobilharzia regenti]
MSLNGDSKQQIEDICVAALRESDIERQFNSLIGTWKRREFSLSSFKHRGHLLLDSDQMESILQNLDESIVILKNLLSNQEDTRRFYTADRNFLKLMGRIGDIRCIVTFCVNSDISLHHLLNHINEELEICQKSLTNYLQMKRKLFPRLYFIPDSLLVEIIGQMNDTASMRVIHRHINKLFTYVEKLNFINKNNANEIVEVCSFDGERLSLMIPIRCESSCEIWLSNLLHSIRHTLQKLLESMHHSIVMVNDDSFMEILINNPTQLGILCLQSLWTKDICEMLSSSQKISLVNIYSSMVYHKYDCGSEISRILGKHLMAFECSNENNVHQLISVFKGLTQSGSWGIFGNFNYIEETVLSVISQYISFLLNLKNEKKLESPCWLDKENLIINKEFGIFITLNSPTTRNQDTTESMKNHFRFIGVVLPDCQMILRIRLATYGFSNSKSLARKLCNFYKDCERYLCAQIYYDFGLRNIISILDEIRSTHNIHELINEEQVLVRHLRDRNLHMLTSEDEPLFLQLLSDYFPSIKSTDLDEQANEFVKTVEYEASKNGLSPYKPWISKIINVSTLLLLLLLLP